MQIDLQNQNPHHKTKQKSLQVMGAATENKVWIYKIVLSKLVTFIYIIFNKTI